MPKILMAASEAMPFVKTGGLADVMGALPAELVRAGEEVAVVLPWYRDAKLASAPREAFRDLRITVGPTSFLVDIFETVELGVRCFLVSCPPLFDRAGLYGAAGSDFPDNHIRFAVYCRAVLGVMRHLFRPRILHCHDWQAALAPLFMRYTFAGDPTFFGVRVLFTIHNIGFQGIFPASALYDLGIPTALFLPNLLEFYGNLNLLMGGMYFSDWISTVSPTYAVEIQGDLGFGLQNFLRARSDRVSGILNGIDYDTWSPEKDRLIARNYSETDLSGKSACRQALLDRFRLRDRPGAPVVGVVSRLTDQKGFDLVAQIAAEMMREDLFLVVLGSGDASYEQMFRDIASAHPEKAAVHIGYDEALSHMIEAGADMFLMPSRYEPCGLNQMYSLHYGTPPIVRATGGLEDSVVSAPPQEATGFKFRDYSGAALLAAVRDAVGAFGDRPRWREMMRRGMRRDFSWAASAGEYAALYRKLLM
ncbi:MAG TPA: glycogen synthase GlgA [Bryobacteraceae bacterium]|nr:glycogen synthase GlgA [Bryobacteraceae bacterium]